MALLSKGRLSKMMLHILLQLPSGTKNLKEIITLRLGLVGQMSATRDINAAWDETKSRGAKLYPDRFVLDKRNVLQRNDGSVRVLDENISSANLKKLNELAEKENCSRLLWDALSARWCAKSQSPPCRKWVLYDTKS